MYLCFSYFQPDRPNWYNVYLILLHLPFLRFYGVGRCLVWTFDCCTCNQCCGIGIGTAGSLTFCLGGDRNRIAYWFLENCDNIVWIRNWCRNRTQKIRNRNRNISLRFHNTLCNVVIWERHCNHSTRSDSYHCTGLSYRLPSSPLWEKSC